MPVSFDTLMMMAVTEELKQELTGAVVQRVYEPERGEVVIHFYAEGKQPGLLFSYDSRYARVHKVDQKYRSLDQPSPFCMLLRKYLVGGRSANFDNPPLERILEIDFDPPEGMKPVKLFAEIMARRSNLILVDEDGIILGAAKTASLDKNPARAILPGEKYLLPPKQEKLHPGTLNPEELASALSRLIDNGKRADKALVEAVGGISPLAAREILHRCGWDTSNPEVSAKKLQQELYNIFCEKVFQNKAVLVPGKKLYAAIDLTCLPEDEKVYYSSPGKMLEKYYNELKNETRELALRESLQNTVEKRLGQLINKKKEQQKELDASARAPQHRLYGEILLAYGNQVPKGAESAMLPDIYNPDQEISVPLDPSKSASFNAQLHFKKYRKAKQGRDKIRRQLGRTKAEIDYCNELLYTIEKGSIELLEEIRSEMIQAGYLREKKKGKKGKEALPQPLSLKTSSGHTVLVGRNNRQNDYITFKAAVRRDTWFHVKDLPGSHVVLKEAPFPPPESDLEEAAFLAAYFSKGSKSSAVAVDYTEVRHVRRRPGGKPGAVLYENYETITVNPQNEDLTKQFQL